MKPKDDLLYQYLHKLMMTFGGDTEREKSNLGGYRICADRVIASLHQAASALVDICTEPLMEAKMGHEFHTGFAVTMTFTMDSAGGMSFILTILPSKGSWFPKLLKDVGNPAAVEIKHLIGLYETEYKIKREI